MDAQQQLVSMHRHLMYKKFSYHSFSVIHRPQDIGFHVIFMESVREKVTEEIKGYLEAYGFTLSYVS